MSSSFVPVFSAFLRRNLIIRLAPAAANRLAADYEEGANVRGVIHIWLLLSGWGEICFYEIDNYFSYRIQKKSSLKDRSNNIFS